MASLTSTLDKMKTIPYNGNISTATEKELTMINRINPSEIEGIIASVKRGSTALLWRHISPSQLARARGITTPVRRRNAFIAVARDATISLLMKQHSLKRHQQVTAAIRAGDPDADFDAINRAITAALFPNEVQV